MASIWGPVTHPREHHHPQSNDEHVRTPTPSDPVNTESGYDATDARQDDSAASAWKKVDHLSGPANERGEALHHFDDGPGPWKQT